MKTLKCVLVLFAFVGLLLLGCSDQLQSPVSPTDQSISGLGSLEKSIIREFTAIMVPTGGDPNAGFTKYPDGKIIMRGILQTINLNVTYPDGRTDLPDLLSGTGDLELNGTVDIIAGTGFFWGKLTLTPAAPEALGGQWQLTWHGKGILGASGWIVPLKELGHGEGGALTGIQVFLDNNIKAAPAFFPWTGAVNGYTKSH